MDEQVKVNILVVDDRPEGLLVLEAVLAARDRNIVKASSGRAALKSVLEHDFALIILDVQMPDMDGFTTAEFIRKRVKSRSIPIIFVSAISKEETYVFRGYEAGAVDYIFKPFEPYILNSKVNVFLDLYRKTLALQKQAELLRESEQLAKEQERVCYELESLRRYRALSEAIPHVVWCADRSCHITYFNRLWMTTTGLTERESLGEGWLVALHEDDREGLRREWDEAASKGESFETECRFLSISGEYRWNVIRVVPELAGERGIIAWLGTNTDIQERKMSEQVLLQGKEMSDAANKAKSEFLANMSHEIRTPLGAILGFSELLADPEMAVEERLSCAENVRRSGAQLTRVIDDILDLSRVETGNLRVDLSHCSLDEIMSDIHLMLAQSAKNKSLAFSIDVLGSVPRYLWTDATKLKQILLNLVGNAIKFTARGRVHLEIAHSEGEDHNPHFVLSVTDTGEGISESARARLFKPFMQADSSTKRKHGGTGLGLALARRLALALGGDLVISRSEPGIGSTFIVTFLSGATAETPRIKSLRPVKTQVGGQVHIPVPLPSLQGLKVLVVDDAPENQLLMTRFLQSSQAIVECADNGLEGVEKARTCAFDVVLMDIQMPIQDGYEAIACLRSQGYLKPIVALTAHALKEDKERCLRCGADAFLTKPISRQTLVQTLARFVPDELSRVGAEARASAVTPPLLPGRVAELPPTVAHSR